MRLLVTATVGVIALAASMASAGANAPMAKKLGCGKGTTGVPAPKDARATPYLQGNASPPLPPGEPKKVSVLAVGAQTVSNGRPDNSIPLVIRNNKCARVTSLEVAATIRDASGKLVASATSQGIDPVTLGPGEVGIGHLYLGLNVTLPQDAKFEYAVSSKKSLGLDQDYFVPGEIADLNATTETRSDFTILSILGTLKNPLKTTITGPFGVAAVCFDQSGTPLAEFGDYADGPGEELAAGQSAGFNAETYHAPDCPIYLVGGSGYHD
jgi:hypothetical protein